MNVQAGYNVPRREDGDVLNESRTRMPLFPAARQTDRQTTEKNKEQRRINQSDQATKNKTQLPSQTFIRLSPSAQPLNSGKHSAISRREVVDHRDTAVGLTDGARSKYGLE